LTKKSQTKPTAVVITPTTGNPKVLDAIESVRKQTYPTKHVLVVDGEQFTGDFDDFSDSYYGIEKATGKQGFYNDKNTSVIYLKDNTGQPGFYGHRIFAGVSHLVNEDYVFFLDQDNWFEPDHVKNSIELFQSNPEIAWVHSLRNVYDKNKKFLCRDNCESLGKWPVWNDENSFHVDTSSYSFNRQFLIQIASLWHGGYAQDRKVFNILKQNFRPDIWQTTGQYTLNYRLDGNANSASPDFFKKGNEVMKGRYQVDVRGYPWNKQDSQL